MTPEEHARQKAWVIASEMLMPTRAARHGVYANRTRPAPPAVMAPLAAPVTRTHVYVVPVVTERQL